MITPRVNSSLLGLALLGLAAGVAIAAAAPTNQPPGEEVLISSLNVSRIEQGWGEGRSNRSVGNQKLTVAGRVFENGVGTHANSIIPLEVDGNALALSGSVGVDDETGGRGSVVFKIEADGREIWNSGLMKSKAAARDFSLEVKGVKSLDLLATDGGDGSDWDHADWGDLKITMTTGQPRLNIPPVEEAVILTPKPAPTPRLTGAALFGVRPGSPFLFTVTATGDRPMTFSAKGLPRGLRLDKKTGQITGKLKKAGEFVVTLRAKNALGQAERKLKIVCGAQTGLTPAMGWNSWNCFAHAVSAEKIKAAADALVNSGLVNHGWTYINIDDFWQVHRDSKDPTLQGPQRDSAGRILPNPRFPDMNGLTDCVHGKGLKIGIYSVPGPWTCGGCVGSFDHELQDAQQYAQWGFDYLKYDWCSYNPAFEAYRGSTNWNPDTVPNITYAGGGDLTKCKLPFKRMHEALAKQPRDILFSLCQYGMGDVWKWGTEVGGNSWRTTQDINDSWGSMAGIGFNQAGKENYAGPGHFNDPDMLVVGKVGWGNLHPTKLTPDEQYTHISLWCLLASPLLIGCDMTQMDEFTLGLLTNDEVLDVNQDPLGRQAARVSQNGNLEVWAKDMEDGSKAVGLFNRGAREQSVAVKWSDLGLTGEQTARDLWRQQDLGKFTGQFEAKVGRHGVVLVKIKPAK
jgi:alpha-galactosidase